MKSFFLIGAIQALFFAFLVGSKRHKSYADKVLVVWLVVIGVHLLHFLYNYSGWYTEFPYFIALGVYFPVLHGPLFYLYFHGLIEENAKWQWLDLWHFVPFIIANALLIPFHMLPWEEKIQVAFSPTENLLAAIRVGEYLNNFWGPIYIVVVLYQIRKYQLHLKDVFSFTENVSLQWVKTLAYGLAFIWVVVLFVNITPWHGSINGGVLIYIAVVLFVFSIGYFGFKQTSLFTDYKRPQKATQQPIKKYEKSGLTPKDLEDMKTQLIEYLENTKPYLNSKLTLNHVAHELGISKHNLSQVINDALNISFFDLINGYRVEEFKHRIANGDIERLTILGVAHDCGFNSKASFNRIFKNQTGQTPSQFIQNS